jgi:glycosyltransferase involved in cell wall biosynthesis
MNIEADSPEIVPLQPNQAPSSVSPLRILHVAATLKPSYGGPATATPQMCFALAELGHSVTLICSDEAPVGAGMPTHPRLTYEFCPRLPPHRWAFSWLLSRRLLALISAADIVEIHSLYYFSTWRAASLCRRMGTPYVVRPHGALNAYHRARRRWKKRPYEALIDFPALRSASAVLCDSELERQAVALLSVNGRLEVVPVGVDVPPADRPEPATLPLVVLYLGRVTAKKRVDILLRGVALAIAAGAHLRLSIVGSIDPDLDKPLKDLTRRLGLSTVSTFYGLVEDSAKSDHLKNSHVFVLISDDESFALAALEAMANGLATILSTRVGISAWASIAGACLTADDADQLSVLLTTLARDLSLCDSMGIAARALVMREFSWPARAQEMAHLYADVTGPERRP